MISVMEEFNPRTFDFKQEVKDGQHFTKNAKRNKLQVYGDANIACLSSQGHMICWQLI
jgi:hypothetical protein